ncbi:MAG: hypothetical protein QME14_03820 [Methanobacteriaceae archaeon]|nr:hypothetical protein [Methanobacteriaceae archaeon]
MFDILIEDLDNYSYRLGLNRWTAPFMILIYPVTWPIVIYRFGNWIFNNFHVPLLRIILFIIYYFFKRITEILTGIEIAHNARIGRGLFIGHLGGIIIGNNSMIGNYSSFHEGVTVGGSGRGNKHGSPIIGDLNYFGAGAKVIGKIKIGDNVILVQMLLL